MLKIYLIISLASFGLGAGAVALLKKAKPEEEEIAPPVVVQDQIALEQQEIIKQLTDIDLLSIPCSADYLKENNSLLCREMFCRMMTRGIDAKTAGNECEEISNIANTREIIKSCSEYYGTAEECHRLFTTRK